MSHPRHSPGLWTAIANVVCVRGNKIDREICVCNGAIDQATDDANARLIAKAPEMLTLIQRYTETWADAHGDPLDPGCLVCDARALLREVEREP